MVRERRSRKRPPSLPPTHAPPNPLIPKIGRSSGKALTSEQTRALLDAMRGDPYELAIRLALVLGGRRGEIAGLRREVLIWSMAH